MSDSEEPKSWKERIQSIIHKLYVCFRFPFQCLSYLLEKSAVMKILGYGGRIVLLWALITWICGGDERRIAAENQRKAKQYQAWQVITASGGRRAGGGRKDALEDLNKDDVSLSGVDISKAYLPELNLPGAQLADANLAKAELYDANLAGADLVRADLGGAHLVRTDLAGAQLYDADLAGALLAGANLARAHLIHADLAGASLMGANLAGAHLGDADLAEADLRGANLAGADLIRADLGGAYLTGADLKDIKSWRRIRTIQYANIYDVNNPPEGFIEWATAPEQGAVLIKDEEEWKKLVAERWQEQEKQ